MKRTKTGLALIGLCALTVVAAELGARATFWVVDTLAIGMTEAKIEHPAYEGSTADRRAIFREMVEAQQAVYAPYSLWRHQPFSGEFVNVDADGHRRTTGGSDEPGALRVWVLGGSTVFGYGVPDSATIPSQLAHGLSEAGTAAAVLNLGEDGYVSMQELVRLEYELHRRQPPELVIAYSGFNDSMKAWAYPDQPAIHDSPALIRERFERPLLASVRESALYRLVVYVKNRYLPSSAGTPMDRDRARAAGRWTAEIWMRNMRSIEALGERFGFGTMLVFQPSVELGGKPLDDSETRSPFRSHILRAMHEQVVELAAEPDAPGILDLTGVFDTTITPVFVDAVHLSGRGNAIVAERLVEEILVRHSSE